MRLKILASVMIAVTTGSACASDGQKVRQVFRQMDQNGDRALQFAEIQTARATAFDRLDSNRNGVLDDPEARAALKRANASDKLQMLGDRGLVNQASDMDSNGDGRITRAEFAQYIPDRLRLADANRDNELSVSELRSLRQR